MCCISICWKFHYFSSKIAFTFLHRQPSTPFSESTPAIVSSTILNDFGEEEEKKKKNLISKCVCWSLLACLVNQTLLSCLSVWLAGWLQRGPMRDNRRKENSHEHTYTQTDTLPSFKQLQMALIPCPLSFTIYQVTYSEWLCRLFMLWWDDLMLLCFVRRRGANSTN